MKKIIISGFVAVIAIVTIFIFFTKKESDYGLHLAVGSWTEQGADYPDLEFDYENIRLYKTNTVPLEEDSIYLRKFKVVKIKDNSITISTSTPLSENRDGIYLKSQTKFVIKADKPLILRSITMDAGEGYIFTLVKKE